jgi:hypothetical protein
MPEPTLDNQTLMKRTLVTMGIMVGGCAVIVGTLTLVASAIAGHAAEPADSADAGGATTPPAATPVRPGSGIAKPTAGPMAPQRK